MAAAWRQVAAGAARAPTALSATRGGRAAARRLPPPRSQQRRALSGSAAEEAAAQQGETWTMVDIVGQAGVGCAAVSVGMLFGLVVRGTIEEYQHTQAHGSAREREENLGRIQQKLEQLEEKTKGTRGASGAGVKEALPLPPPGMGSLSTVGGVSHQLVDRASKITNRVLGAAAPIVKPASNDPARREEERYKPVAIPTGGEEGWELQVLTPLALHPSQDGADAIGELLLPLGGSETQSLVGGLRSGVWGAVVVRRKQDPARLVSLESRIAVAEAALAARLTGETPAHVAITAPPRPLDLGAGGDWEGVVVFTSGQGLLASGMGLKAEAHCPAGGAESGAMTALLRYCATLAVTMDCGWMEWAEAEANTKGATAIKGFGPLGLGAEEAVALGRGRGSVVTRWRLPTRMCRALSCVDPTSAGAVPVSDDYESHKLERF